MAPQRPEKTDGTITVLHRGFIRLILDSIDIEANIKEVEIFIKSEKNLSPVVKAMFEVLLLIVTLLLSRLGLNSQTIR